MLDVMTGQGNRVLGRMYTIMQGAVLGKGVVPFVGVVIGERVRERKGLFFKTYLVIL